MPGAVIMIMGMIRIILLPGLCARNKVGLFCI